MRGCLPDSVWKLEFGAAVLPEGGVRFRVWAPRAKTLAVKLSGERTLPMERGSDGVFETVAPGVQAGADYLYLFDDGRERPDPVSRWQPSGVHAASRVVDPNAFSWTDRRWKGIPLRDLITYELHVGTFTPEGSFESVIPKLGYLRELGITAVELMPVAQFPGGRNWGYDGVHLYAPQSTYGGPAGLKKLVDACHREGLAVILDVVYNHIGPEGKYLGEYGPYFTDAYRTPWGQAINFDGRDSDAVRRFFVENALYWLTEYHMDGLRLDAIHGIFDFSARHILEEIAEEFHRQAERLGRQAWVIAESDLNDARVIRPRARGGYGVDAQWSDDFHHSMHTCLTGSNRGYLSDFGRLEHLRKAICDGFVYDGKRSEYRRRRHGNSSRKEPGYRFVVYIQNHDQIANACQGERVSPLVSLEQQKLAAAVLCCAPNLPMIFMGQEFSESAPFYYFTSHGDPDLIAAVREGRRQEFAAFTSAREFPDPQAPETFEQSRIQWPLLEKSPHTKILRLYRDLLRLRKREPSLSGCRKDLARVACNEEQRWMTIELRGPAGASILLLCNFSPAGRDVPLPRGKAGWKLILWTGDARYGGEGGVRPPPRPGRSGAIHVSGHAAVLYKAAGSASS